MEPLAEEIENVAADDSYPRMLLDHVRQSWRHAVRALNTAESSGKRDHRLKEIVAMLSQELEFMEVQVNGANAL